MLMPGDAIGVRTEFEEAIRANPALPNPLFQLGRVNRASLEKHARVIDMLHGERGMRVFIVLCPNIEANKFAATATFESRHFYWSDTLIDPGNSEAVRKMVAWREKLLKYLEAAGGVAIMKKVNPELWAWRMDCTMQISGILGRARFPTTRAHRSRAR
jgi:hypothetical protein